MNVETAGVNYQQTYEQLSTTVSQIPGVERVTISPNEENRPGLPLLGVVTSNLSCIPAVHDAYDKTLDTRTSLWNVAATDQNYWKFLVERVGARELLDYFVGSQLIEAAAEQSHESWRANKHAALADPNDPYQGYGPERRKVQDLNPDERRALRILPDADPSKDVYHPLDVPYMRLSSGIQSQNVVPMAAACLAIGDFLIDDDTRVEELDELVTDISQTPERQTLLNTVTHVAWMASDLARGGRPWTGAAENYHLYSRLSPAVQDIDAQASAEPVSYIHDEISSIPSATSLMRRALIRENGPYESWWAIEHKFLDTLRVAGQPLVSSSENVFPGIAGWVNFNEGIHMTTVEQRLQVTIESALQQRHIALEDDRWRLTAAGMERLASLTAIYDLRHFYLFEYIDRYVELKDRLDTQTVG
jgi:hypothetical protein